MNTKTHRLPVITLTLTSLLGLGAAGGAVSCAQAADAPSRTVSYKDLDLSRAADVHKLYGRLERASAQVCGAYLTTASHIANPAYTRCYQSALESAVLEVRSPELLALDKAIRGSRAS